MDSRSLSPKSSFDFSKSPYYQSLLAFKKKTFSSSSKQHLAKDSPLLQQIVSERKKTEEQLLGMEHRVLKMKRKEEQAAHQLQTAKQKADMLSATRLHFEEVTVT